MLLSEFLKEHKKAEQQAQQMQEQTESDRETGSGRCRVKSHRGPATERNGTAHRAVERASSADPKGERATGDAEAGAEGGQQSIGQSRLAFCSRGRRPRLQLCNEATKTVSRSMLTTLLNPVLVVFVLQQRWELAKTGGSYRHLCCADCVYSWNGFAEVRRNVPSSVCPLSPGDRGTLCGSSPLPVRGGLLRRFAAACFRPYR
jgi:hypothetical protein